AVCLRGRGRQERRGDEQQEPDRNATGHRLRRGPYRSISDPKKGRYLGGGGLIPWLARDPITAVRDRARALQGRVPDGRRLRRRESRARGRPTPLELRSRRR